LRELFFSNARFIYRKSHTTAEVHRQEVPAFDRDGFEALEMMAQPTQLISAADLVQTGIIQDSAAQENDDDENRSCLITRFEDIGWIDPFPTGSSGSPEKKKGGSPAPKSPKKAGKDGKKAPIKKIDFYKQVYPDCKMKNPDKPPMMIFMPTSEIMQKMIKACLNASVPQDALSKF